MTPGTLVLLGFPPSRTPYGELRAAGHGLVAADPPDAPEAGPRYVAGAALRIGAAGPRTPLVLVAYGAAGPALPALGGAQRAAHRLVGGYVFVDAEPPAPAGDWPDAPCGYLATSPGDPRLDAARLRAWRTAEAGPAGLAPALLELIEDL
ncbi:hypothetical protein [Actinocorallia populi]|uniref:hypothetical protein n=1 Tax=Actinocorallia populi TaxID=2079200 RepID=UPI000D0948A6|nr:hypothetical protein [Actinocorallia populi]